MMDHGARFNQLKETNLELLTDRLNGAIGTEISCQYRHLLVFVKPTGSYWFD